MHFMKLLSELRKLLYRSDYVKIDILIFIMYIKYISCFNSIINVANFDKYSHNKSSVNGNKWFVFDLVIRTDIILYHLFCKESYSIINKKYSKVYLKNYY